VATSGAIEAVWRLESAKLIAALVRMVRDVALAEDLAQDALVAALQQWPESGVPKNPGAWLMTTAKRRAIDQFRHEAMARRKLDEIGHSPDFQETFVPDFDAALDDRIEDDLLRLIFICCHPVLTTEARVALTLRLLGGLSTSEIARAFLAPEPTIGQRVSRAKKSLEKARVPFEEPGIEERKARLESVLEVLYLIYNEGYSATAGDDWMRPALCYEAVRLGRLLVGLMPDQPSAHGLVALMELQSSRIPARTGPDGEPVLLLDQNRGKWDQLLLRRGLGALERAEALTEGQPSTYVLQAGIAACHARAREAADTDWPRIASLYKALSVVEPSPIVELNRAVAVSMAEGPAAGLAILDGLADEPALRDYHLLPTVRGDLLSKLGRNDEARAEFLRAAQMTANEREKGLLREKADAL